MENNDKATIEYLHSELKQLLGAYNTIARDLAAAQAEIKMLTRLSDFIKKELEVHDHTSVEAEIRRKKKFLDFPVEETFAAAIRHLWFSHEEAQKTLAVLRPENQRLNLLADAQGVEIDRLKARIERGEG